MIVWFDDVDLGTRYRGAEIKVTRAGAVAGYQYSSALKNSGFAWDQASFADFMQNPRTKVPATKWLSRV